MLPGHRDRKMEPETGEFTLLLHRWRDGDSTAEDALFERVLPDLRRLAHYLMSRERPDHTLQATGLVNEAYLRLVAAKDRDWRSRQHFFAIAARIMRRYLIDAVRARHDAHFLPIDELGGFLPEKPQDVDMALFIDQKLNQLAAIEPDWCRVVEVKYFLGLTDEEAAEALNVKRRTLQRMWSDARKWLHSQMQVEKTRAAGAK
jgi:RNA polymerase sigma factor (TIGR02999 family)